MALQTRWTSLGLTVGTRLIARDTVAVDTRARLATSWIFRACSLVRNGSHTSKNKQFSTMELGWTRASAYWHVSCDRYLQSAARCALWLIHQAFRTTSPSPSMREMYRSTGRFVKRSARPLGSGHLTSTQSILFRAPMPKTTRGSCDAR